MFKCKYLIAFLVICVAFTGKLKAQVEEFSTDPVKFSSQVEKHLASFDRKDAKEFSEKFILVWNGLDASVKSRIMMMSNKMLLKKFRPYPEFKDYWAASIELTGGTRASMQSFEVWQGVLEKLIDVKQKDRFQDFLASSSGLVIRQDLYTSNVVTWKARKGNFKFENKDGKGIVVLDNVRFTALANEDSTVIDGASGVFDPNTNTLQIKGGKVYFTRAGLAENETFAVINKCKINTKAAAFKADSVLLTTPYFTDPLLGEIDEKVIKLGRNGRIEFPNFQSYKQDYRIKDVVKGVDYLGGFTLKGNEFVGTGTPETPARLLFYNGSDKPFIQMVASVFSIEKEKISAIPASAIIHVGDDTISHPYLRMEYTLKDNLLTLARPKEALGASPFNNSYQKLDMKFEALYWTQGDSLLRMGQLFGSTNTAAEFQSEAYIDKDGYNRLNGMGGVHPAQTIAKISVQKKKRKFELVELATALNLTVDDAKPIFYELANLGLLELDPFNNKLRIREKLFLYTEGLAGKRDNDAIVFFSDLKNAQKTKYNAWFNIKTRDMQITGLQRVVLSEPQYVRIYPDSTSTITVHKNRQMTFGGIIAAGSTEYFGHKFVFDYEKFNLSLLECDSMRIRVWPFEQQQGQVRLSSLIEDVKGEILIDGPKNKAGYDNKKFHDYPKLKVSKETYVYYDKNCKYKGIYNRKDFLFIIAPFEMDSLDNFNRDFMAFAGIFKSAGIFPDMAENLKVQPDYSLGFVRKMPAEGLGMYKDKTMFKNTMRLSSAGLQGDGKIEFLTSTAISDAFTFFPDSTAGIATEYVNLTATKPKAVPAVKGVNAYVKYVPSEKVLVARSVKEPLQFFENQATLKGRLFLTPEGMTGRGRMQFANAMLNARKYVYTHEKILSDTAEFDLSSADLSDMAFKTHNVRADVDFAKRMGNFKANGENSFIEFPENQYIAYMDEFKWFMDVDDIELVKKTSLTIESSEFERPNFYSTHPKQDSLSFMAPFARFNVNTKDIKCSKVPFMDIADARIVPDSGLVTIHKKAKMEPLKNAQIVANNITKNHLILNATVEVNARRDYEASGDYYYKDETGNAFKIHFAKIKPDETYQTFANGAITKEENFRLSPNFEYYGKVELRASNQFLVFDGATRIAHNCAQIARNWMNFRSEINPLEIYIPVADDMKDLEGAAIGAGLIWSVDSAAAYATFLSQKSADADINVMSASGFLFYDKGAKEYRISNREKLKELSLPGNFISMHTDLCLVSGDGRVNLDFGLGQMKLNTVGSVNYNMGKGEISMRLAGGIAFPFLDNAAEKMFSRMKVAAGLEGMDITTTFFKKSLTELSGQEVADKVEADITLSGKVKGRMPDAMNVPFYLGDVRMRWDAEEGVFLNDGKAGISNVYKDEVLKYFKTYIMIRPQRGSGKELVRNTFSMYIEVDEKYWYFFEYSLGNLTVISSDQDFNNIIAETKADKLKYKGEKGVDDFEIRLSSDNSKVSKLKRNFED
jgi:hypothetical protein